MYFAEESRLFLFRCAHFETGRSLNSRRKKEGRKRKKRNENVLFVQSQENAELLYYLNK
jgi:hypothetical protein